MKKLILFAIIVLSTFSCTQQYQTRKWGGSDSITLPKGERLIEATWKDNNLWYLTEPMDSDYKPQVKIFRESSSFGVFEGTAKFIEQR